MKKSNLFLACLCIMVSLHFGCNSSDSKNQEKTNKDTTNNFKQDSIKETNSLNSKTEQHPTKILIAGSKVNIRESANAKSKVLFQIDRMEKCDFLEKGTMELIGGKNDYWYKIKYNNKDGWVFGAFTSLAQGPIIPEGTYDDGWYDEESGDGGCNYIVSLSKKGTNYTGNIVQGYPDATDGSTFPKQELKNIVFDEITGKISFDFNSCTNIDYMANRKETWEVVKANGKMTSNSLIFEYKSSNNNNYEAFLLKKVK